MMIFLSKIFIKYLIAVLLWVLINGNIIAQEHDPLKYDVKVTARIVPLFAVDSKGNPVYDLKKEEIEFYVNGKPIDFHFHRYTFENEEEKKIVSEEEIKHSQKPMGKKIRESRRVIFIVVDSVFNSVNGLKRAREIAVGLVQDSFPGDDFILIENTPGSGLKYIAGPERDEKKLMQSIQKFSSIPGRYQKYLFAARSSNMPENFDLSKEKKRYSRSQKKSEQYRYKLDVRRFGHTLFQLRYALKTIVRPKIVFLISEGIVKGAFMEKYGTGSYGSEIPISSNSSYFSTFLLNFLREISRAVNDGGSVLYTINPRKVEFDNLVDDNMSGEASMAFMAHESGGEYFEGSDPSKIVSKIKKTTAAYYELGFSFRSEMEKRQKIKVTCRREGVKIHSIQYIGTEKSYRWMAPVEKKLFALNVATGGSWSRIVGKVAKTTYKVFKSEKHGGTTIKTISVDIPEKMINTKVDIFILRVNPIDDKVDIKSKSKVVNKLERLKIHWGKKHKYYFVIIEPSEPYCIFSGIR